MTALLPDGAPGLDGVEPPTGEELPSDFDLSSDEGEGERLVEPEPEPEPEPEQQQAYEPRERAIKALRKLEMSELLDQARALGVPQDVLDQLLDRDGDEPVEALYSILLPQALEQAEEDMETERVTAAIVADLGGEDRLQVSGALRRLGLLFTAAAEDGGGELLAKRSAQVVAAGGLLPLLEIVQSRIHVELRRHACLVLASLAATEALQSILIEAGMVEVLVSILRPGRYFEHQQLACSALANMAFYSNSAAALDNGAGDAEGVGKDPPEVVQRLLRANDGNAVHWLCLLLKKGDRRSKQWSGACLCNLSQCPASKPALVKSNIVGIIKQVLCKINSATSTFEASRTEGLQELLLGLLCNLALDDEDQSVRARIVQGGAMTASIMLLHSSDAAVQEAAAAALGGITTPAPSEIDSGLKELIRSALREPQFDQVTLPLIADHEYTSASKLNDEDEAAAIAADAVALRANLTSQEGTTPMQSLAECALESESDLIRQTAQLVLDNLRVDVTTAANEKHFTAVTQVVADCVDDALEPVAPRTLRTTPFSMIPEEKLASMVMALPSADYTFVDIHHPVVVDLVARRAAGDPTAEEMLPYESDDRLLDGRWYKIPNEVFAAQMSALEQMVEEVEPCRQELVSFGVDMGVYLESYFKQVREAMADKAGVLTSDEVEEMEAQLRVRVGEQRNRTFERIAAHDAAWKREQLTTMTPQLSRGSTRSKQLGQ